MIRVRNSTGAFGVLNDSWIIEENSKNAPNHFSELAAVHRVDGELVILRNPYNLEVTELVNEYIGNTTQKVSMSKTDIMEAIEKLPKHCEILNIFMYDNLAVRIKDEDGLVYSMQYGDGNIWYQDYNI